MSFGITERLFSAASQSRCSCFAINQRAKRCRPIGSLTLKILRLLPSNRHDLQQFCCD